MFEPTRESAHSALMDFLPKAGRNYATKRNYDKGIGKHDHVSQLSPWIRTRMIPEWEIIKKVLAEYNQSTAEKFVDEVCWRTYWKGWLQLRPEIWDDYCNNFNLQLDQWGAKERYLSVTRGDSGIECLDVWTDELVKTGYLHNHARMWYASIWIHTLQLPWTLGAAFFLTHLLDGDPASNTLSWRWVAGLHTVGKTYLARPDNIRKYTENRFKVDESLAEKPIQLEAEPLPKPRPLQDLKKPQLGSKIGLIVQEDDLSAPDWLGKEFQFQYIAGLFLRDNYKEHRISDTVIDFRFACLNNVLGERDHCFESIEAVVNWAKDNQLNSVVMAEIPVGLWSKAIPKLESALKQHAIELCFVRHWWDEILHPHAKSGFFRFKKAIPEVLSKLAD